MQPLPRTHRSGIRSWFPIGLAVVLLANLIAAIGLVAGQGDRERGAGTVTGDPHRRPVPTSFADPNAQERQRNEAVRSLLVRRGQAILARDRDAFLATIAPGAERFRARQARLFDNLAKLPLDVWRYEIAPGGGSLPVPDRLDRYGTEAWIPRLVLRYRLRGFDAATVSRTTYLGFVRHPSRGWIIGGEGAHDGYRGDREIWQLGPLKVVRRSDALVVGVETPRSELARIADGIGRAEPVVSGVWGTDWPRRAVVFVARTHKEASVVAADHQDLSQIAALATVATGPDGVPPPGAGDRIVIDYKNFRRLGDLGRQVVLTHELTHLASRGSTTSRMPLWLVEGFADYVAYRSVDISVRSAASDLRIEVQAGRVPGSLPSRSDFAADAEELSEAYAEAWLAGKFIADRYGQDRLVRLYRFMGQQQGTEAEVTAAGLSSVLGVGPQKFTTEWRAYLRKQLG